MARPHAAALIEDAWHRRIESTLRGRGWRTRIVAHTGYGSPGSLRVLARVLLTRGADVEEAPVSAPPGLRHVEEQRGWRAFITTPATSVPVTVTVGGRETHGRSDRSGHVDLAVAEHDLGPGWHEVTISSPDAAPTTAPIFVVGAGETFGIISDIDDTVISTSLPRPFIAAWNTFVKSEDARHVVPGMATMYRELLRDHPGAPIVYVSTGAWNTAPTLTRFLARHGYPRGPLLLTDWGPTNTGWFRSGQDHKRSCLHRLARQFPDIRWLLVGDDGQHDPKIYGDFAEDRPEAVEAIAIRELTPAEQVLSHGIPVSNEELAPRPKSRREVPVYRAGDGYALLPVLRGLIER